METPNMFRCLLRYGADMYRLTMLFFIVSHSTSKLLPRYLLPVHALQHPGHIDDRIASPSRRRNALLCRLSSGGIAKHNQFRQPRELCSFACCLQDHIAKHAALHPYQYRTSSNRHRPTETTSASACGIRADQILSAHVIPFDTRAE